MKFIGVDLHTEQLTACFMDETGNTQLKTYRLTQMQEFVAELCTADQLAVEATGNSRWFVRQVRENVSRVVVVNPSQFEIISRSAKKTDERDAVRLAEFLRADLLPAVRLKSDLQSEVQSLCGLRKQLIEQRTRLINRVHALVVSKGGKCGREQLASKDAVARLLQSEALSWSAINQVELKVIGEQIKALNSSVAQLDEQIQTSAKAMEGFENLISIKGIGARSAAVLLSVIGEVEDFADEGKLASYFGIVPRVRNSAETVHHGRITRQGSKLGRTTLVQCTLVAIRYSPYLKKFYQAVKTRRGSGKAIIATARKFLGIIYNTLKNKWVFADFPNFVLVN